MPDLSRMQVASNGAAPSGTVTFLFSDIEGSTHRWDRDRAAMQAAVRLHDALVGEVLATHGGYVFKTLGDGFCVAFTSPNAALRAAIAAQNALAGADFSSVGGLQVRIAIHSGTADERDGDYFGPAVNRVARLLSLGHGGQVLLSGIAAGLTRDNLPQGAALLELGRHRLKDLTGDELVHQLVAPGLRRNFPELRGPKTSVEQPWLVPEAMRTIYFTGREELLVALRRQLADRGRAALCGLGGAGKTQAALEYAARFRAHYQAGVFWVNAETTGGLTSGFVQIAQALRLAEAGAGDQAGSVRAALEWFNAARGWLLIFDNVEERNDLAPFLPQGGNGNILITSRETVFQELGIPRALEVRDLSDEEALRFLLARTGREDGETLEHGAAAELAAELGNLPLALEQAGAYIAETAASFESYLAAFRKRRLALLEKASGLVSRDTVSVTWAANFAAVAQASPESADVLRLSAFLAPDAVPFELFETLPEQDEMTVMELLRPLARYSLIRTDAASRAYGVHRLVQEIVRTALEASERRVHVERAIAALDAALPNAKYASWARCDRLVAHVVSIADWAAANDARPEALPRLLNNTGSYLVQVSRYAEAETLLQRALALGRELFGSAHLEVANSLSLLATVRQMQTRFAESEALHAESLALREGLLGPDDLGIIGTVLNFGNLHIVQGHYAQAQSLYERAVRIWQLHSAEDSEFVATAFNNIARVHEFSGRYEEARQLDERALGIRERMFGSEHPHVALSYSMLANGYRRQRKYAESEALQQRALEIRERTLGPGHDEVAESLNDFADLYLEQGRFAEARSMYERALGIRERVFGRDHPQIAADLHGLGYVHLGEGKHDEAERLFVRSLRLREQALESDHADVAKSLLGIAELRTLQGRNREASAHFERALSIRQLTFAPDHPELIEIRAKLEALREEEAPKKER